MECALCSKPSPLNPASAACGVRSRRWSASDCVPPAYQSMFSSFAAYCFAVSEGSKGFFLLDLELGVSHMPPLNERKKVRIIQAHHSGGLRGRLWSDGQLWQKPRRHWISGLRGGTGFRVSGLGFGRTVGLVLEVHVLLLCCCSR